MIRGMTRPLMKRPVKNFPISASIHNRFDVEIVDARTGNIKQKAFGENVICDQLWTRLCANSSYNTYIHYGNGSGTPSTSDTSLFGFLGYLASSVYSRKYDHDTQVLSVTTKVQLSESTAAGKTLTEVGIAYSNSSSSLVTHAMLRDMNGNPVSLEKSDTDVVNIYATIFVHLNLPEGSRFLGTLHGSQYSSTVVVNNFMTHFAGLTNMPNYPFVSPCLGYVRMADFQTPAFSYDVDKRTIKVTCPRLGVNTWNYNKGLKSLVLGRYSSSGNYPISEFMFDVEEENGWYSSTPVKGESLGTGDGTTLDFATDFGFVKNLVVYVDGTPVDATVDPGYGYNIGHYLRPVIIPTSGSYYSDTSSTIADQMWATGYDQFQFYPINANKGLPIYENILYKTHGIATISGYGSYAGNIGIMVSQDMVDWVTITTGSNSTTIPEAYRHYRYWRIYGASSSVRGNTVKITSSDTMPAFNNVHLAEAPPEGAVITADYDAICIGKDANHVFDFSVTFQFNEYNEG